VQRLEQSRRKLKAKSLRRADDQSYKGPIVRQGLTGKVLAYNPGWNFVVLNIGDKSGLPETACNSS
jgi:hypothetical protein